jgi:hypothetical protein
MLSAVVETAGLSAPVRIRNISATGALIEGAAVPQENASVTLRRNNLSINGKIVWCRQNRCGIHFEGSVDVAAWIRHPSAIAPATSAAQMRVDQIQADVRAGTAPFVQPVPPAAQQPQSESSLEQRLAEEMSYVQRLVESIADELIDEPVVVSRHPQALQKFDLVNQILGHLATILTAQDRLKAVEGVGMEELRARLLRR